MSSWVIGKLCAVSCLLVLVLVQLGVRCQPVRQYDTLDSSKRTTMYTEMEGLMAGITMKVKRTPVYLYVDGRRSLESWTSINRLWNAVIQKCFVGSATFIQIITYGWDSNWRNFYKIYVYTSRSSHLTNLTLWKPRTSFGIILQNLP